MLCFMLPSCSPIDCVVLLRCLISYLTHGSATPASMQAGVRVPVLFHMQSLAPASLFYIQLDRHYRGTAHVDVLPAGVTPDLHWAR